MKRDEIDEGEGVAVVGLALGRFAEDMDRGSAPQPKFQRGSAGRNRPAWAVRQGAASGC
jgi:hypothetical protein